MTGDDTARFGQRLRAATPLLGTFIKTPSVHATEILGGLGYDFVLIDEEHGPFDRHSIDLVLLATRAARIAGVVRVAGIASILAALDMGAAGIVVPHVNGEAAAAAAVAAARYQGGQRGFSPSPRAGGYGTRSLADHVAHGDEAASITVMIEHPDAVGNVDAIAAVDGVDALFLGLGDLAVASGETSADAPAIRHAAGQICRAARHHGKALMATTADVEGAGWLLDLGVHALVVNSDQGLLKREAARQREAFQTRSQKEQPAI